MNKRWNIIIVTLFITLIIWIMWLIITKYLVNLVEISSENHKYYKAYYSAYAGIELELWKIKNHGMWFEDTINKNSQTVSQNITWVNYYFSSSIHSTWKYITSNPKSLLTNNIDCSNMKNYISLWTWEALMLPLIYDKNNWSHWEWSFSWINYQPLNINSSSYQIYYKWDVILSFQSKDKKFNKQLAISNIIINKNLQSIFPLINFASLVISNKPFLVFAANKPSKLCIQTLNPIFSPYSYIQSKWNFMDRSVQLNVIKNNKWANFSVYWIY